MARRMAHHQALALVTHAGIRYSLGYLPLSHGGSCVVRGYVPFGQQWDTVRGEVLG